MSRSSRRHLDRASEVISVNIEKLWLRRFGKSNSDASLSYSSVTSAVTQISEIGHTLTSSIGQWHSRVYFFVWPRAKMLATKFSTSVALDSL